LGEGGASDKEQMPDWQCGDGSFRKEIGHKKVLGDTNFICLYHHV
jgi:hypothetical protein